MLTWLGARWKLWDAPIHGCMQHYTNNKVHRDNRLLIPLLAHRMQRYINAEGIGTFTWYTRAFTAHCCAESVRFSDAAAALQLSAHRVSVALHAATEILRIAEGTTAEIPVAAPQQQPTENGCVEKEASTAPSQPSVALALLMHGAHSSCGLRWFDYISWCGREGVTLRSIP